MLSLIYVGLGVRQNARAVRLSTSHAVSEERIGTRGFRAYWDARKYWFSEEFQRYDDERMVPEARPEYQFSGT